MGRRSDLATAHPQGIEGLCSPVNGESAVGEAAKRQSPPQALHRSQER